MFLASILKILCAELITIPYLEPVAASPYKKLKVDPNIRESSNEELSNSHKYNPYEVIDTMRSSQLVNKLNNFLKLPSLCLPPARFDNTP